MNKRSSSAETAERWPALPFSAWQETYTTLHMWTQIVGKVRLALSPPENHWWQVALYVTPRGLTTSSIPYQGEIFEVNFDFISHNLTILTSTGASKSLPLIERSVANFYQEFMASLQALGIHVSINTLPSEVSNPIRCDEDQTHASYDAEYAQRFWRILVQVDTLFKRYRSSFIGKSSPVNFYWGSFDLALTRFSGRLAPQRLGADRLTLEAYSHEVLSCGFWPGNTQFPEPAFYAYAAPEPPGFKEAPIQPTTAFYSQEVGEFLLRYEDVRHAANPEQEVLAFFQSAYEAGASLGGWDRKALER